MAEEVNDLEIKTIQYYSNHKTVKDKEGAYSFLATGKHTEMKQISKSPRLLYFSGSIRTSRAQLM